MIGYYDGRAGEDILDLYATIRREKFMSYVDRRSKLNMRRLFELDPDRALEDDKFLRLLAENEKDADKAKAFLLVSGYWRSYCEADNVQKQSSIEHDFTQHYTS